MRFNFFRDLSELNAHFSYVRPLVTIEPTAIALGLPVNTQMGYKDIRTLRTTLLQKKYHDAVIYVAWEHCHIIGITQLLLKEFGHTPQSITWNDKDYNKVFVFKIYWNKKPVTLHFYVTTENLFHLSKVCPNS